MSPSETVNGSCLCGKISLAVKAFDRQVVACHCQQCRKQTGSYVMAAATTDDNLVITGEEHLGWYAASDFAKRGFCIHCASILFWKRNNSTNTSIMAGCLESPTGLTLIRHIFVADKGDFYTINDKVPQFAESD